MNDNEQLESKAPLDLAVLEVAAAWANLRSKDPTTKVGAAVYDEDTGAMFLGYNGFPQGVPDWKEVWEQTNPALGVTKYELVVHAEVNAVQKALRGGANMSRSILYCTHHPCPDCMRTVIAPSGIKRVAYRVGEYRSLTQRGRDVVGLIAQSCDISMWQIKGDA